MFLLCTNPRNKTKLLGILQTCQTGNFQNPCQSSHVRRRPVETHLPHGSSMSLSSVKMFLPGHLLAMGVFVVVLSQVISSTTGIYLTRACLDALIIPAKIKLYLNLSFPLLCGKMELNLYRKSKGLKFLIVSKINKKSREIRCEKEDSCERYGFLGICRMTWFLGNLLATSTLIIELKSEEDCRRSLKGKNAIF